MSERWTPASWRDKPIQQVPSYPDSDQLKAVEAQLTGFPPLVFAGEARKLKKALGKVDAYVNIVQTRAVSIAPWDFPAAQSGAVQRFTL